MKIWQYLLFGGKKTPYLSCIEINQVWNLVAPLGLLVVRFGGFKETCLLDLVAQAWQVYVVTDSDDKTNFFSAVGVNDDVLYLYTNSNRLGLFLIYCI
jgi:hypothetical protein